jgi:hypothetical protein
MRLKRAVVGFCAALAAPGLGLLGCGGDKGTTASDSDGVSASESASSTGTAGPTGTTTPTEASGSASATEGDDAGSMSASMSGTTEISGGMSASMSGSETGDESTSSSSSSGTTGMISGGGETSASTSTGAPVVCADFNSQAECEAADCMAITARPFVDDQATWCLDPPSFLACLELAVCDQAITTACKGQTKYQFNNGCLAPGFAVCVAPPDAGMDGYADCV